MDNNVLYFPYIRIPQSSWFTRVLLYWDEIGSIVPYEYQRQRVKLGHYMQNLVEAGLVKEVVPSEHHSEVPEFRSAFLKLIDENSYIERQRASALEHQNTFRIHIGSGIKGMYDNAGICQANPLRLTCNVMKNTLLLVLR